MTDIFPVIVRNELTQRYDRQDWRKLVVKSTVVLAPTVSQTTG